MTWVISDALALAQLQATLARLAMAPGPATVLIYATAMPADTDPLAIAPDAQVTIPLESPPGAIVAGVLKLAQQSGAAPGPACIRLYTSTLPAAGDAVADPGGLQAELPLASPPGVITAGVLKLAMAGGASPMVLASGVPRWGLLVAGDGVPLARGDVTDNAHDGSIRITGGTTAPGETAPTLYAGGLVGLSETFLT